jgi:hypothetical protein
MLPSLCYVCVVIPCKRIPTFLGTGCLHLRVEMRRIRMLLSYIGRLQERCILSWRWKQHVPSKHWYLYKTTWCHPRRPQSEQALQWKSSYVYISISKRITNWIYLSADSVLTAVLRFLLAEKFTFQLFMFFRYCCHSKKFDFPEFFNVDCLWLRFITEHSMQARWHPLTVLSFHLYSHLISIFDDHFLHLQCDDMSWWHGMCFTFHQKKLI